MKKKIFGAILIVAIAVTASWNFNQSKNEVNLSDLGLANVEALALGESSSDCENHCPHTGYMCILKFTDGSMMSCPGRWS